MDYTFTLQQNQLCDWWRTQCFVQRTKDIKVHYQLLEREKALQEEGTMKPTETEEKMTYFYIKTLLLEARRI